MPTAQQKIRHLQSSLMEVHWHLATFLLIFARFAKFGVDGNWGLWNGWSSCSTTCGLGVESRTRQCNDPAPVHGGYGCPGNQAHQRSYFPRACPVHGEWSGWGPWDRCSSPCGTGLKKRYRTCTQPPPSLFGHYCLGDNSDYGICQGDDCGNNMTTGTPPTTASHCHDILSDCDTANKTLGVCNTFDAARKSCPEFCGLCGVVDGVWASWSHWSQCSASCGRGTTTRSRSCSSPPPRNGGAPCPGDSRETFNCTLRSCPVHGGWGFWSHWSACSSTCGQGMTRRTRVCDNPRPGLLGNLCFGYSTDFGLCLIKECPGYGYFDISCVQVDGGWTEWSLWFSCSATCGNGHGTRQRTCSNPKPANGGSACSEPQTQQNMCKFADCPVNGGWTSWTSWTPCSSSVARGLSQRTRSCTNPSPSTLGHACVGDSTDKRPCPGVTSAFSVTHPVAGSSANSIRFTQAITNLGSQYSTSTGTFTCVYPGIYSFALHLLKNAGTPFAHCTIIKNAVDVVQAHSDPEGDSENGWLSSSASVVLHLVHGDKIGVVCSSGLASINVGYTYFSGFLIKAD